MMSADKQKRKFAIYGGTFDPLHLGHMMLAKTAVKECGLYKLIFMPDYVSPFKQDRPVTDGMLRYGMIQAATAGDPAFAVSSYEICREGPSYTIETLRHWDSMLDGSLSFVLGFDSAVQVDTWYCGDEILKNYHLITAVRPDTDTEQGMQTIERFRRDYGAKISVLGMEPVDISSTDIRRRAAAGESLEGYVSPGVEEYIIEHKLYRQ